MPDPTTATLRLLIVEDDRALSAMLVELFTDEGYQVEVAHDAQRGLHGALTRGYDAFIVDRGLPVMDGVELVAVLRSRGIATPILVLTARGSTADRVEGLDAGAQDYLVKPFEVAELLARIRALVRRPNLSSTLWVEGLCLDRVTRTVSRPAVGVADVELSEREAALLSVLMRAPGRTHTREQLLESAFDGVDTPGVVDTYVHYLRRKLGRNIVATVHGTGYRLGGAMTPVSDLAVVRRAGRIAALQASLALAALLLVVGAVIFLVDGQVQKQQITDQLTSVATTADDTTDPPPGMHLVLRDLAGKVSASAAGMPIAELLARPAGFSDVRIGDSPNRVLVADKPQGRVVALLALDSYQASRRRLLLSLGAAEFAGILASIGVVVLLTRRSLRPLTEALALQRRFVADASHELRTPLTVLHTRIQLLARRFDDGDAQQAKEQIEAIACDTRVLGDVIDDLLASATMASTDVPHVRVDVGTLVEDVHASMTDHAESAGVTLILTRDVDTAATAFTVLGSAAALRRAVTSLVDNALAHEHAGGSIDIHLLRRGPNVVIDVRDDGVGVDPDAMKTMFTRFSYGHGHTVAAGRERYGIGLALVREIAVAHHGDITVAPTPGGGATFTLTVAAAPSA